MCGVFGFDFYYFAFHFGKGYLAFQHLAFRFVLWYIVDILPILFLGIFPVSQGEKTNLSLTSFWFV